MFGIHSEDLSDELIDLVTELNKSKVALWKQMHIIEIVAAELADRLGESGTKFEMEPDRVIWPDGTITKKNTPPLDQKEQRRFHQLLVSMAFMGSSWLSMVMPRRKLFKIQLLQVLHPLLLHPHLSQVLLLREQMLRPLCLQQPLKPNKSDVVLAFYM